MQRSVQVEPPECQELHKMMEEWKNRAFMKQDEIPRTDRPGMSKGYFLYVEDDAGWFNYREEAATYQVLEEDDQAIEDDAETISSTSMPNYDHDEVKASLTNISEVFHTIAQEYEKLTCTVPHMTEIQAAQVIARLQCYWC